MRLLTIFYSRPPALFVGPNDGFFSHDICDGLAGPSVFRIILDELLLDLESGSQVDSSACLLGMNKRIETQLIRLRDSTTGQPGSNTLAPVVGIY